MSDDWTYHKGSPRAFCPVLGVLGCFFLQGIFCLTLGSVLMTSLTLSDAFTPDSHTAREDLNTGKGHGSAHSTWYNSIPQGNTVEDTKPATGATHPERLLSGDRKAEVKVLSSKLGVHHPLLSRS